MHKELVVTFIYVKIFVNNLIALMICADNHYTYIDYENKNYGKNLAI